MKKYVIAFLLIGVVLFSCQKNDDKNDNNSNQEKIQLITNVDQALNIKRLVAHPWYINALLILLSG